MVIKINDVIKYYGSWGRGPMTEAKIIAIDQTEQPGEKYGRPVSQVDYDLKDHAVFTLDNRRWCYGDQIVGLSVEVGGLLVEMPSERGSQ